MECVRASASATVCLLYPCPRAGGITTDEGEHGSIPFPSRKLKTKSLSKIGFEVQKCYRPVQGFADAEANVGLLGN